MDSTQNGRHFRSLIGPHISVRLSFIILWVITNIVGFVIGSLLGATDNGLISHVISARVIAHVLGDLVFAACFGFAQWLLLYQFFPDNRGKLWWWIPATMLGFMIGARTGAHIAPAVGSNQVELGAAFGAIMGIAVGAAQWVAIKPLGDLKIKRSLMWIPISVVAWVIGESIAFDFGFRQLAVPLEALAIALVSGIGLLWWIERT